MISIPAKELSLENFDQYGSFSRLINPDKVSVGPAIHEFFCDQLVYYTASASPVGISTSTCSSVRSWSIPRRFTAAAAK